MKLGGSPSPGQTQKGTCYHTLGHLLFSYLPGPAHGVANDVSFVSELPITSCLEFRTGLHRKSEKIATMITQFSIA